MPHFLTVDTKLKQIDQCSAGGVIGGDDPADANQFPARTARRIRRAREATARLPV